MGKTKSQKHYEKKNPYRVWVHVGNRKFVVRGKDRDDVLDWGKRTHTKIGKETSAGLKKRKKYSDGFRINLPRI